MKMLLLLTMLALAGCDGDARHDDVSAESRSREAIGARYEVVGALDAYGIRRNSAAPVDYVTLIPRPGIAGSEVGFEVPVRPGSTVTVRKVHRTTRLFDRMTYIVELEGTSLPAAVPVRIDISRGNEGDKYLELNPKIYRKLPPG